MKVATITCHDVYNCGASLQAYALQHYIESLGVEYVIIDYKPFYLSGHYKLLQVNNPKFDRFFLKQIYLLIKLPERLFSLIRKQKFDQFKKRYFHLSKKKYYNNRELILNPPVANLYIAGSDQIWNTLLNNGLDSSFYLNFVNNNGRRISYAASFATDKINSKNTEFVSEGLGNFDAISVRETSALKLLNDLGFDGIPVLDPVFLVDKTKWENIISNIKINLKPYILIYDFDSSPIMEKIAKKIKNITGHILISITPHKIKYADKNLRNIGPLEFVYLIKNAQFVISNSFHATVFSIIFEKKFSVLNRTEKINTRMRDFLDSINLLDKMIFEGDNLNVNSLLSDINYNEINLYLRNQIEVSKSYLKTQIKIAQSIHRL